MDLIGAGTRGTSILPAPSERRGYRRALNSWTSSHGLSTTFQILSLQGSPASGFFATPQKSSSHGNVCNLGVSTHRTCAFAISIAAAPALKARSRSRWLILALLGISAELEMFPERASSPTNTFLTIVFTPLIGLSQVKSSSVTAHISSKGSSA